MRNSLLRAAARRVLPACNKAEARLGPLRPPAPESLSQPKCLAQAITQLVLTARHGAQK